MCESPLLRFEVAECDRNLLQAENLLLKSLRAMCGSSSDFVRKVEISRITAA